LIDLFIISFGVAMDATAVAIAASVRGVSVRSGAILACCFGGAQAAMGALGWLGGAAVGALWTAWDHWIALLLLTIVGAKMIREAFESEEDREPVLAGARSYIALSIATSIDALAVGVSLPALGASPVAALSAIGGVTFAFTAAGAAFGRLLGERFGRKMEIAGGIALIVIGVRIVMEHT
jgi:putative Mn2+ efflux pump MntP